MLKCRELGLSSPLVMSLEVERGVIEMELIVGLTLRDLIIQTKDTNQVLKVVEEWGRQIGRLHDGNVVHGDLTTSNVMVREGTGSLVSWIGRKMWLWKVLKKQHKQVFIDFGLAFITTLAEDKAVDLYVMERAFVSSHPNSQPLVRFFFSFPFEEDVDV